MESERNMINDKMIEESPSENGSLNTEQEE